MSHHRFLYCLWVVAFFPVARAAPISIPGRIFIQGGSCAIPASGFTITFSPQKGKGQEIVSTITLQDGSFQVNLVPGSFYVSISQGGNQVYGDTKIVEKKSMLRFTLSPIDPNAVQCAASTLAMCSQIKEADMLPVSKFAAVGGDAFQKDNSLKEAHTDFKIPQFDSCELRRVPLFRVLGMSCKASKGDLLSLETSIKSCLPNSGESGTIDGGRRLIMFENTNLSLDEESDGSVSLEVISLFFH